MIVQDILTIVKKILVGIIVLVVPLFLFLAALWLVRHLL